MLWPWCLLIHWTRSRITRRLQGRPALAASTGGSACLCCDFAAALAVNGAALALALALAPPPPPPPLLPCAAPLLAVDSRAASQAAGTMNTRAPRRLYAGTTPRYASGGRKSCGEGGPHIRQAPSERGRPAASGKVKTRRPVGGSRCRPWRVNEPRATKGGLPTQHRAGSCSGPHSPLL